MRKQIVVALGKVDPSLVVETLGPDIEFVSNPTKADLSAAVGAIARATLDVDASLIDSMPNLKVIARTGVGTDRVDLLAASAKSIQVVITPGANSTAVAEGVIAMMLHLVKRLGPLTQLVQAGEWENDQTIGIIGMGSIGQRVAKFSKALGMHVIGFDTKPPKVEFELVSNIEEIYQRSDIITLHVPLLVETQGLISNDSLTKMKQGVIIINCGRGALIELNDVLPALNSGKVAGLGLDVFDPEPPQPHPIFQHPNVVLTPHVMGLSKQATLASFTAAAQGVRDVLEGRKPAAIANAHLL
jgi:D-3-phosphoglycerate dehydrogenase / 2-oxoglutarate reductase